MITVKYEEYHNDNNFHHYKKDFANLDHLRIWMKNQMNVGDLKKWDYTKRRSAPFQDQKD